jgi:tetratricopeptide (TPR) repeat protein
MKTGGADPRGGELMAAYELGLLPPVKVADFEEHVRACPACADEIYEMSSYVVALRGGAGVLAQRLRDAPSAAHQEEGLPERLRRRLLSAIRGVLPRPLAPRTAAAFAAVALGVLALVLIPRGERSEWQDLAQVEPLAYAPLETRDAGAGESFERGMILYAGGRYREAASILEDVVEREDLEPAKMDQARLYAGICRLLTEEAPRALPHLEEASRSSLPVVADRARWYLAQASLVMDDPETAASYLRELADLSPGYGARARSQLDDIAGRLENPAGK